MPAFRRGGAAAVGAVVLLVTQLCIAGCTAGGSSPSPTGAAALPGDRFVDSAGMLYPPEGWGFLAPSATARLMHHEALAAIGKKETWTVSAADTFEGLTEEWSPSVSASLMDDSGLFRVADEPWTDDDVRSWYAQAVDDGSVDEAWMSLRVAASRHLALTPTSRDLERLRKAADGDAVPNLYLDDITRAVERGAEVLPTSDPADLPADAQALRAPQDAATLMVRTAKLGKPVNRLGAKTIRYAETGAASSDIAYCRVVQAYALAGERAEASRHAADFDDERLLPGGEVLESPLFNGSPHVTFHMLRYFAADGGIDRWLSAGARNRVADALEKATADDDATERVAAMAALSLLRPGGLTLADRRDAITQALAAIGIDTGSAGGTPSGTPTDAPSNVATTNPSATVSEIAVRATAPAAGARAANATGPAANATAATTPAANATAAPAGSVSAGERPLDAEQALGWVEVAAYATALGLELSFPGLDSSAIAQWLAYEPDESANTLALYVTAVRSANAIPDERLVARIDTALRGKRIADVPSSVLFPASLALLDAGAELPFSHAALAAEINRRSGQCLGGFSTFVRETRAARTVCDVDVSYSAVLLRARLDSATDTGAPTDPATGTGAATDPATATDHRRTS